MRVQAAPWQNLAYLVEVTVVLACAKVNRVKYGEDGNYDYYDDYDGN